MKNVKNGTMSFKIFTLVISAFGSNGAKLHLHSLHRSGEINKNVLKLFDFYSLCELFTVEVRQRWKQLPGSVAETIASFLLSKSFLIYTLVTILPFKR
jgi:hypothetical protein